MPGAEHFQKSAKLNEIIVALKDAGVQDACPMWRGRGGVHEERDRVRMLQSEEDRQVQCLVAVCQGLQLESLEFLATLRPNWSQIVLDHQEGPLATARAAVQPLGRSGAPRV